MLNYRRIYFLLFFIYLKGGSLIAIKRKDSNGNWVLDQQAIETSIIDLEGNFESTNVEGALRELAE